MDANKDKKLEEIGYKVHKTCGLCKHFRGAVASAFGVCTLQTYQHLKHTGDARQLSVNVFGSCSKFEWDETERAKLHAFVKYVDEV